MSRIPSQPLEALAKRVDSWLLPLLIVSYAAATFAPQAGIWVRKSAVSGVPLTVIMLASLLFLAGMSVDLRQVKTALHRGWLLGLALLTLWLVPSVMTGIAGRLPIELPDGVLLGLGLAAIMPAAASSVAWSQVGRGNLALSFGVLAISTLLCPLFLSGSNPWQVTESGMTTLGVALWVVAPGALGGVTRWIVGEPKVSAFHSERKLASSGVLLLLNYSNAALALPHVFSTLDANSLSLIAGTVLGVCLGGFLAAWLIAKACRVEADLVRAFVFGAAMKNTGMAMVLAGLWLESQPTATLTIILFTLFQHLGAAAFHRLDTEAASDQSNADDPEQPLPARSVSQ